MQYRLLTLCKAWSSLGPEVRGALSTLAVTPLCE